MEIGHKIFHFKMMPSGKSLELRDNPRERLEVKVFKHSQAFLVVPYSLRFVAHPPLGPVSISNLV